MLCIPLCSVTYNSDDYLVLAGFSSDDIIFVEHSALRAVWQAEQINTLSSSPWSTPLRPAETLFFFLRPIISFKDNKFIPYLKSYCTTWLAHSQVPSITAKFHSQVIFPLSIDAKGGWIRERKASFIIHRSTDGKLKRISRAVDGVIRIAPVKRLWILLNAVSITGLMTAE